MIFLGDKRSTFLSVTAILLTAIFAACNSADQKQAIIQQKIVSVKPVLTQPFRYHKAIEVSPGNIFDIFSWGRGAMETGSFLILKSDSTAAKYTTTTGDLDGTITDVYNTDMDMDGNPEILIQVESKDSTKYNQIYAFEYKDNKAQKLDFPKLTSTQKKGYRGQDKFYLKEGVLMREFLLFEGSGADAKPTADKRVLEYGIRNNSFTVKTIAQQDENKKQAAATTDTAKKTLVKEASVTPVKTSTESTTRKKHHVVKERRRRHSTKKTSHKRSSSRAGKKHRRHRR